jgi:ATP-dependent DNA ligase
MIARAVEQLPDDDGAGRWSYEAKMDGFRCLAFRTAGDRVMLQSRQQRSLTRYFPEVVAALLERVPAGTVLDGELVVWAGGKVNFSALQQRIHPSSAHHAARVVDTGAPWSGKLAPATFVVFDVLTFAGQDLRTEPYRRRRKQLRNLLADSAEPLLLMPATRELAGAHAWMDQHTGTGIEGVNGSRKLTPDRFGKVDPSGSV